MDELEQRMRNATNGIPSPSQMHDYLENMVEKLQVPRDVARKRYHEYNKWYAEVMTYCYVYGSGENCDPKYYNR